MTTDIQALIKKICKWVKEVKGGRTGSTFVLVERAEATEIADALAAQAERIQQMALQAISDEANREGLLERIAELERERNALLAFAQDISKQKPEKPDHWSSCGQCEHNIEQAQDIIESSIAAQAGSKEGE